MSQSLVNIQIQSVLESVRQSSHNGELFRIWNGCLYPETIEALEALGVSVVPNINSADSTKQYVLYNIEGVV